MNISSTLLLAFVGFGVFTLLMAVGYIFRGNCIKGTCGGLNQMKDENGQAICEACAPEKVKQLYPEA